MSSMPPLSLYSWKNEIKKALKSCHNSLTFEDIVDMVQNNRAGFVELRKAFAVLEFFDIGLEKEKHIHVLIMGGNRHDMIKLEHRMCEMAKAIGVKKITAVTRKGIARSKWWNENTTGWKNPADFIEKEL